MFVQIIRVDQKVLSNLVKVYAFSNEIYSVRFLKWVEYCNKMDLEWNIGVDAL